MDFTSDWAWWPGSGLLVALPTFLVALVVLGGRRAHPNAPNNGRVESGT
jgi:hypothetical protein